MTRTQAKRGPKPRPAADRFWEKVDQSGGASACWLWTGAKTAGGYGRFDDGVAHRFAYRDAVGPIPNGLDLDHTCHTKACDGGVDCPHRACVNPAHLEPVTRSENLERGNMTRDHMPPVAQLQKAKTHCKHGHEFTPSNTYRAPLRPTLRQCRQCHLDRTRARRAK